MLKTRYISNILLSLGLIILLQCNVALAESQTATDKLTQYTIQAGYLHQMSADIDSGGDFSADRFFLQAGLNHMFRRKLFAGISLGGGQDRYNFSGSTGLGGTKPWANINNLRISTPIRYVPEGSWSYLVVPSLRFNYENGASMSDSQTWGVLAGATYRISKTLSVGPGIGVFSQLEDDTNIFPILVIDWRITPTLSLETGRGFAATQGPGLQLRWDISDKWTLTAGGRYEKIRFRLDDKGIAENGIGEDKSVPLFATAQYKMTSRASISGLIGVDVDGSLRLENEDGDRLNKSDYDPAPLLALVFKLRL